MSLLGEGSGMNRTIFQGDVLEKLAEIESESIDCIISSPPYWGLRDYGTAEWEGGNKDCDHKEDKGFNKQNLAALADKYDPQKNPRNPNAYDTGKDVAIPNFKNKSKKLKKHSIDLVTRQIIREMINEMVSDVINTTKINIKKYTM